MKTQAYFENIQQTIKKEINKANDSLYIAVAWFTDPELFDLLCQKSEKGVKVELIMVNDKINNSSLINYSKLETLNGKIWKIGNEDGGTALMHNKFCIIDSMTIINGSYNWTRKAKTNHESITIIYDAPDIALDFIEEFSSIKKKYFGSGDKDKDFIDFQKISIRLDTLKNVILLEDEDDVEYQLKKLKKIVQPSGIIQELNDIYKIIDFVENQQSGDVVSAINTFVNKYKQLSIYIDSEVFALKLEIKTLELNIGSLEDEKTDIEKLIFEFEIRYNNLLGKLVLKILKLRKQKLKEEARDDESKRKEFEEAENDYNKFQDNFNETKEQISYELTEEQKSELKDKYRKASKLCHPDIVAEDLKSEAEDIFKDLKAAYEQNDLNTMNSILSNLDKGIFVSNAINVNEKEKLNVMVNRLRHKREEAEKAVNQLKNNETYITIRKIKDWDIYFAETKEQLINELHKIEKYGK